MKFDIDLNEQFSFSIVRIVHYRINRYAQQNRRRSFGGWYANCDVPSVPLSSILSPIGLDLKLDEIRD